MYTSAFEPVSFIGSICKLNSGLADCLAVIGHLWPVIIFEWNTMFDLVEGCVNQLISLCLSDEDEGLLAEVKLGSLSS